MDGAGADDDQQAVIGSGHDVVDGVAGVGNQLFNGCALDREKADQMLGRWQHGNVLDAFVIGNAGTVGAGVDFGGHGLIPWVKTNKRLGKKKPPGVPAVV